VLRSRQLLLLAALGFASGLPLYLTTQSLQAWMRVEGVDLTTIGLFGLVALPYSLKFLWAPVMDRVVPPFLGRRRGWLIITQVLLVGAIAAMAAHDPARGLQFLALNAVVIAFLSASQDIVGDAYRTDVLSTRESAAGAAVWVTGYRIALITTGSVAFFLADRITWPGAYVAMAALMLVGIGATLLAAEPASAQAPQSLLEAVVLPFREFLGRRGVMWGLGVLAFIVIYRLPDSFGAMMATPFLLDAGYSQSEIGVARGAIGIAATIVGTLTGGALVARIGLNRALWIFAALQAVSNAGYWILTGVEPSQPMLVGVMLVENFCGGLVTAGFLGFLMSLCAPRFSATQFALLSSLLGVSRDLLVAPSGAIAEATGWPLYFLGTIAIAIPGMMLLPIMAPWGGERPVMSVERE
jgi:PAT family beta-lactamase induction signal transducer AmpG